MMQQQQAFPAQMAQMQRGIGGLGGNLDRAFDPLKNMLGQYLTENVVQEKVEPFVEEVKQMAQERFDLGGGSYSGTPHLSQVVMAPLGGANPPKSLPSFNPFSFGSAQVVVPRGGSSFEQETPKIFQKGFQGYADGGPVMRGLGSFLASNLDEFGRNGDTEIIHATKSEVMMPKGMMDDPSVRRTVRDLFEETGRDMEEYTVGSGQMNVNPVTGYEEAFDFIGGIKDIFKKAAPFLLPAAVSFMFPGMSPFVSGAIAGGVGSLLQGGDMQDAFKAGLTGGLSSAGTATLFSGGDFGAGFKPLDDRYSPFQMRGTGSLAAKTTGSVDAAAQSAQLVNQPQPQDASFLQDPVSGAKNFLTKPQLTADSAAKQLGFDSYAAIPDATGKAAAMDLVKSSGGINYATAIPAGLGLMALAGGFDPIEEDPPEDPYPYTTRELLEMYPERYRTGPVIAPTRRRRREDVYGGPVYAAKGGEMEFPRREGYIAGPGTETSDDIPAMLSDGEFVMTARAVRGAGDGSRQKGVEKMYDIMRAFEGGVVA